MNLQNFQEQLFYRAPKNSCFWNAYKTKLNENDHMVTVKFENIFTLSIISLYSINHIVLFKTDISTAKNTVISPDFLVWKLCLFAKFPQQEIRWNYGIFSQWRWHWIHMEMLGGLSFNQLLNAVLNLRKKLIEEEFFPKYVIPPAVFITEGFIVINNF